LKKDIPYISFKNKRKDSQFDLLSFKDLMGREDMADILFNFQQIDFYMLLFITEGQGLHTIDFTEFPFHEGSILSIRKDQIHKFHRSNADGFLLLFTKEYLIQFIEKSEVLRSLQLFNELISDPKVELNNEQFLDFKSLITNIKIEYKDLKDEHSLSIIRSLLHILVRKIFRIKFHENDEVWGKKYLEQFSQFQNLVEKQCFTSTKVADYASQMAVSTKTLNNITNHIVNKSAKTFINEILLTQIKRFLINTNLTVQEIGYETGFTDPSNLFKFFKRVAQVTPEEFRTAYRN
jgi:AraC family transcriptional activator of pobA